MKGFAIIHLIRNPEVQKKMQEELEQVCGEALPSLNDRSRYLPLIKIQNLGTEIDRNLSLDYRIRKRF